jgi:hypothetical protein
MIRKIALSASAAALLVFSLLVGAQSAQAVGYGDSCYDLWYARNSIYHRAGYCFRTEAAIREFGNAGCRHSGEATLPLTPTDREIIELITLIERQKGC